MESAYILEEVRISSENKTADGLSFAIREGDIILDKTFRFQVLPAAMDRVTPISRRKVTNEPAKHSERLLRIKELGEDSAVIAILSQESYFEGSDTIVTKENERVVTVSYGQEFSAYAKQQWRDASGAIVYRFIIKAPARPQQSAQKFCRECGAKMSRGDKFCRECGTPAGK